MAGTRCLQAGNVDSLGVQLLAGRRDLRSAVVALRPGDAVEGVFLFVFVQAADDVEFGGGLIVSIQGAVGSREAIVRVWAVGRQANSRAGQTPYIGGSYRKRHLASRDFALCRGCEGKCPRRMAFVHLRLRLLLPGRTQWRIPRRSLSGKW